MQKLWRAAVLPLLAVMLASLAGCFDVTEEIHVHGNLAGEYKVTLSIPETLASLSGMIPGEHQSGDPQRALEDLRDKLAKEKFVETVTVSEATADKTHSYTLDVEAKDMQKLGDWLAQESTQGSGEGPYHFAYSIERKGFMDYSFKRPLHLAPPPGGPGSAGGPPPQGAPGAGGAPPPPDGAPPAEQGADAGSGSVRDRLSKDGRELMGKGRDLLGKGMDTGRDLLKGAAGQLGGLMGGALMGDHYYTVRFYAGGIANTDGTALAGREQGVEWKIPMAELLGGQDKDRVLSADFKALGLSGSMMLFLTLIIMFLFGTLLIIMTMHAAKKRKIGSKDAEA